MKQFSKIFLTIIIFSYCKNIFATHIRAGDITSVKVGSGSSLTYSFTVSIYRNSNQSAARLDDIVIYFGDGTSKTLFVNAATLRVINDETEEYKFQTTHTYQNSGIFTAYTYIQNRNGGILNLGGNISDQYNFYIESQVLIDPLLGRNNSPTLEFPPIDKGAVDRVFLHNAGANDPDGDSLVYELIVPKYLPGNENVAKEIPTHRNVSAFGNNACVSGISIDNRTGTITWDNPCIQGIYNIAFKISEFRNGIQIGYITRDMQIEITTLQNEKPEIKVPKDTCIIATTFLRDTVKLSDPDFTNTLYLSFTGGAFKIPNSPAYMTNINGGALENTLSNPTNVLFNWQSTCDHIRQEPYVHHFKLSDNQNNNLALVDFKSFEVNVLGPSISGINAAPLNNDIQLNWNAYTCGTLSNVRINVMRKSCNSSTLSGNSCSTGDDFVNGFTQIAQLTGNSTTFLDTSVSHGNNYCYYVYAVHQKVGRGSSKASDLVCSQLNNDITFITNVSVTGTSSLTGQIFVKWTKPKNINAAQIPAPYSYELWRKTTNSSAILINTFNNLEDTTFIDNNLNTIDLKYEYQIIFKYGNGLTAIKNTTPWASSVYLTGFPQNKRVILSWASTTPWINSYPTNIYKLNTVSGLFFWIGSTTGTVFEDQGQNNIPLVNGASYTYYVQTLGKFSIGCLNITSSGISIDSLANTSQIINNIIPTDLIPPCIPIISINKIDCENKIQNVVLNWTLNKKLSCQTSILGYKLYFSKENQGNNFSLLREFPSQDSVFTDLSNVAFSGCYKIKSYINSENGLTIESDFSNTVCLQLTDCESFILPNVFTPEPKDGINDLFVPIPTPRLVEAVETTIFNRWGGKIYTTSDVNINWDGGNSPDGMYYYIAKVKFFTKNEVIAYKGWIQLLR